MKPVYVFVEGQDDLEFLQRILPPDAAQGAQIVNAGGKEGIPSLARSFLVRRNAPVAVLMDSDSLDPAVIEELRSSTEDLIRSAASSVPVKLVIAVPEIEAWLFAVPEVIERVIGEPVPTDLIPLGKRDPSGVLDLLATKSNKRWDFRDAINRLDTNDIERLQALPEISGLIKFLQDPRNGEQAA